MNGETRTIDGIAWNYHKGRGYTTEMSGLTLRVAPWRERDKIQWDWLVASEGDLGGENGLSKMEHAMRAAVAFARDTIKVASHAGAER